MARYYTPTKLSENISETPEGFLLCLNVPICRTGYQDYADGETPIEIGSGGVVKIYRSSEEVFRPQTIASFEGKSVTIRHPNDFVNPDNWSYLAKGVMQNIRKAKELDEDGEESLVADLLIMDKFAINLVKNGLREVSCGYEAEYEQTGEGEGIQTNIVGNHIALVEQGRAGSTYAINDEKGKVTMSQKLIDKLKAKLGAKVVDEAMAEEKKESKDAYGMDELVKAMKDMGEKMSRVEGFMEQGKVKDDDKKEMEGKDDAEEKEKPKDEDKKEDAKDEEEEKSEDADESPKMEERLKALEAAVSKLLEGKSKDEDMSGEENAKDDMEESEDADAEGEEGEQSQSKKTGDEAAKKAPLAGTKDVERAKTLAKAYDEYSSKEEVTAEKLNEINAAHWGRK